MSVGAATIGIAALAAAMPSCSDPASPPGGRDARRIVFVARTDAPGEGPGPPGIYSVRADGSRLRRLTLGAGHAIAPAWSRDGARIAFASGQEGGEDVWLMDADGSNPRRAALEFPSCIQDYTTITWDPSGTRLAAECFGRTSVFDLQSREVYALSDSIGHYIHGPDWSPDGAFLVYSGSGESEDRSGAIIVSPEGGTPVRLFGPAGDLTWSPDGRSLTFTAITPDGRRAIFVVNADGSGPRQVTFPPVSAGIDEGPSWSPDGRWLTFHRVSTRCAIVGSPPREVCIPHWSIHVVQTDGTGLRRITPDSLQATRPSWW